jgi:hypothetical protein
MICNQNSLVPQAPHVNMAGRPTLTVRMLQAEG